MRAARYAGALLALLAFAPSGARAAEQLPDLIVRPPYQIVAAPGTSVHGIALRFTATVANVGPFPVDLAGLAVPVGAQTSPALQCVQWVGAACIERAQVGEFVWHAQAAPARVQAVRPEDDLRAAASRMLSLGLAVLPCVDADGRPAAGDDAVVAAAPKVSFCLRDDEPEPDAGGAPVGLYQACAANLQGISPGWADLYNWQLEGQELPIDGVADGEYALVITVNPAGLLHETTTTDNQSYRRVRIRRYGSYVEATGNS